MFDEEFFSFIRRSSKTQNRFDIWSPGLTDLLIEKRSARHHMFAGNSWQSSQGWQMVIDDMKKCGAPDTLTIIKIRKKWENLCYRYRHCSKESSASWLHFQKMHELFGNDSQPTKSEPEILNKGKLPLESLMLIDCIEIDEILTNCRLCQETIGEYSFTDDEELCSRIVKCTSIKVLENVENMPKSICDRCKKLITIYYDFLLRCEKVDKDLRARFVTSNVVLSDENDLTPNIQVHDPLDCSNNTDPPIPKPISETVLTRKSRNKQTAKFTCGICARIFYSRFALQTHIKTHFPVNDKLPEGLISSETWESVINKRTEEPSDSEIKEKNTKIKGKLNDSQKQNRDTKSNSEINSGDKIDDSPVSKIQNRSTKSNSAVNSDDKIDNSPDEEKFLLPDELTVNHTTDDLNKTAEKHSTKLVQDSLDANKEKKTLEENDDSNEMSEENHEILVTSADGEEEISYILVDHSYLGLQDMFIKTELDVTCEQPEVPIELTDQFLNDDESESNTMDTDAEFNHEDINLLAENSEDCDMTHKISQENIKRGLWDEPNLEQPKVNLDELKSVNFKLQARLNELISKNARHKIVNVTINNKFSCSLCSKRFISKKSWDRHMKTHKPTIYKCPREDCRKTFITESGMVNHERKHLGVHTLLCVTCGKGFNSKSSLKQHEKIHDKVKEFSCEHCKQQFSILSALKSHVKVQHEGHRYYCSRCPKRFVNRTTLNRHEKVHDGIYDFICDTCEKGFVTRKELAKHKKYHQGIRSHQCHLCYKSFFEKAHLTVHMRVHTGERPFVCNIQGCTKTYPAKSKLRKHIQVKHKEFATFKSNKIV